MSRRLALALVGPGSHAQNRLLRALDSAQSVELRAVVGGSSGQIVADNHDVAWFPDLATATATAAFDMALIATPNSTHYELVEASLDLGLHVLCEKPLTPHVKSTQNLIRRAHKRGLLLREAMMFLHHPQFTELGRQLANNGQWTLRAAFGFPRRQEHDFRYRSPGGGALLDAGIYPVASACALMDEPRVKHAVVRQDQSLDVDLSGLAVLDDASGRLAVLEWGFGLEYVNELSIWGEESLIRCPRAFSKPHDLATIIEIKERDKKRHVEVPPANHFVNLLESFAESVESGDFSQDRTALQRVQILAEILRKAEVDV